jgi:predicted Kef-type K+ transport protein
MTNFLYTDIIWLATTLILGFLAQRVKLPPLIGFLISGFVLNAVGITNGSFDLNELSELGVLLLLFTIGLKLDLKSIFKAEVIATSSFQVVISIVLMGTVFQVFGALGLFYFTDLSFNASLLVAFALSFSSTVFAVKALEGKGEIKSFHGKTAIGILIVQDVFAVLFLTISKGKIPSVWAFSLPLYLWMVRKLVFWYLNRAGHGELFTLFGLFLALVAGASAFDIMGLKADLGALVIGVLIAKHPRASELAKRLVDWDVGNTNMEPFGNCLFTGDYPHF